MLDTTKSAQGLTLVELLIAVAIIGILAGIVLYGLNPKGAADRSSNGVIATDIGKLVAAVRAEQSASMNGAYPDSGTPSILNDQYILAKSGLVPYVGSGWPLDASGNAIVYTSDGVSFCISARAYPLTVTNYFKVTQVDAAVMAEVSSPCVAM